jgi:hypothetical protein
MTQCTDSHMPNERYDFFELSGNAMMVVFIDMSELAAELDDEIDEIDDVDVFCCGWIMVVL